MSKSKSFSIRAHLRNYTYTAKVDALTGVLVGITAGCRIWKSFAQARKHYNGKRDIYYGNSWRDDDRSHLNGAGADLSTRNFYCRQEARMIIDRLDVMVSVYRTSLRRKAKLIEQAKKPVKKVAKKVAKKKTK